jgi:hypothetical protein
MTLSDLRSYVRDLTGVYSTDILPDALLDRWLAEAYTEVNRVEDWPWMSSSASGTLAVGATTITLATSAGRIKEFAVTYPDGTLIQMIPSKGLIPTVDEDDEDYFYDVDSSGNILISKAFDSNVTYKVTFLKTGPSLSGSGQASAIPAEFEPLLAYRAAVKVLNAQADDSGRAAVYAQEYENMVEALRSDTIIDDDLGPIQIGGEILRVDGRTVGRVNLRYRSS